MPKQRSKKTSPRKGVVDVVSFVYIVLHCSEHLFKLGKSNYPRSRMVELGLHLVDPSQGLLYRTDIEDTALKIERMVLCFARLLSGQLGAREPDCEWFPLEYLPPVLAMLQLTWNELFPNIAIRVMQPERDRDDVLSTMYRRVDKCLSETAPQPRGAVRRNEVAAALAA
jgi:hypothetical protein